MPMWAADLPAADQVELPNSRLAGTDRQDRRMPAVLGNRPGCVAGLSQNDNEGTIGEPTDSTGVMVSNLCNVLMRKLRYKDS